MKKIITLVIVLAMLTSLFVLPSAALTEADVASLKYTMLQQTSNGYSYTADDVLFAGKYCMRGMAISKDGKYMFGGFLNPNGSASIEMWETATGNLVSGLQYIQPENDKSSYPKGLATDDRGYLYAALAYNPNNTRADLATYTYDGGELNQIGYANIVMTNESTKTGVNGITVEKVNGIYYAYVIVNYDVDYLVRLNVNDPKNPVVDTSFGKNGMIDLQKDPYNVKDANYIDVDTDGTIYFAASTDSDSMLYILSPDGATVINQASQTKAYGVALWEDYVFVTSQNSGKVCIYDKVTNALVANISVTADNIKLPIERDDILFNNGISSFCNVTIVNDILFLGDQGDGAAGLDQIVAAGLTEDAAKTVAGWSDAISARLAAAYPDKNATPDTTEAPKETEAPATEPVTEAPETEAPATDAPATDAPADTTTAAPTTDAPATEAPKADEGGCGGFVALGIMACIIPAAVVVCKKKD